LRAFSRFGSSDPRAARRQGGPGPAHRASQHHFLATERLRAPLASFFAALTLSPGLYFTPASYTLDKVLNDESRAPTELHGRALVELATAVRGGAARSRLTPMI